MSRVYLPVVINKGDLMIDVISQINKKSKTLHGTFTNMFVYGMSSSIEILCSCQSDCDCDTVCSCNTVCSCQNQCVCDSVCSCEYN